MSLWLAGTGLVWVGRNLAQGAYRWPWHRPQSLTLIGPKGTQRVRLGRGQTLLDAMTAQGLAVRSECGGGGVCGRCRVQLSESTPIHGAERAHLSPRHLAAGWRLACQQQGERDSAPRVTEGHAP
ncbi:2Fe-2S iron-sulfur cluster binding domain-containing protein [Ferrimonas balearica]|uniref:2Fe-2S iron-sulfur cluster binding domain-containing protein n=1 Tax=Ferrimonas balearica TaxID=44012 RepID=UPI0021BD92FB|nr:2Fe-2S iron-sulfur cluster binding domain-containing protein [Ferrimonas balearica]